MKGYYINPKEKTIKEVVLSQNIEGGVFSLDKTITIILEVDFVERLWYNHNYALYYQSQTNLSKEKDLYWFEVEGLKETKTIFGNALMVPIILEQETDFNIKFLDEYEPPIQDFIL